jgi:hypothetical protein
MVVPHAVYRPPRSSPARGCLRFLSAATQPRQRRSGGSSMRSIAARSSASRRRWRARSRSCSTKTTATAARRRSPRSGRGSMPNTARRCDCASCARWPGCRRRGLRAASRRPTGSRRIATSNRGALPRRGA